MACPDSVATSSLTFCLTTVIFILVVRQVEMNASGMTDDEERTLLNVLREQPDFECLPLPASWFKKYGIPARTATAPREYIESNYAMRKANEQKDLPPLIIDEPQQGGKTVPVAPPDGTTVTVVNRPFEWKGDRPFPAVFVPELADLKIPESHNPSSPPCTSQTADELPPRDRHESGTERPALRLRLPSPVADRDESQHCS